MDKLKPITTRASTKKASYPYLPKEAVVRVGRCSGEEKSQHFFLGEVEYLSSLSGSTLRLRESVWFVGGREEESWRRLFLFL